MSGLAILSLAMTMAAGTDPPAGSPTAADAASRSVSVRLYDYAGLGDEELAATQQEVSEIYATVGVTVLWRIPVHPARVTVGTDPWPSDASATLTVLILTVAMAHGAGDRDGIAGYAAVGRRDVGSVAFVVADRTRHIASAAGLSHSRVVSGVVAHELAHLLMPGMPHSSSGIMRARWRPVDFRFPDRRVFSAAEGETIRRGVARLSHLAQLTDN